VDAPTKTDGGRRSDSLDFCVREILEVGFAKKGRLRGAVKRAGWHTRFTRKTMWGKGYVVSCEERAYIQWIGKSDKDTRGGHGDWWAWLAACADWKRVCSVVSAIGWDIDQFHASRVCLLEDCRILCGETGQAHGINSWISAHVGWPHISPSLETILDGGTCPDPTHELLNVEGTGLPRSSLGHLLRKAFPKRCQIRELLRFVAQYWSESPEIEWFIRCTTFCSIGGFHRHHTMASVPSIAARRELYLKCFGGGGGSLEEWMSPIIPPSQLHAIQCTLLLVLQDTAIAVLAALPWFPLAVDKGLESADFSTTVNAAVMAAHAVFDRHRLLHCGRGGARGNFRPSVSPFENIFFCPTNEVTLFAWAKSILPTNETQVAWEQRVDQCGVFSKGGAQVYPDWNYNGWGKRSRLWNFVTRIAVISGVRYTNIEAWLAQGFGTAKERQDALVIVARAHVDEFLCFCVLLWVFRARHQITRHLLPKRIARKQQTALAERFSNCPILPSYAGIITICTCCADVKNPTALCHNGKHDSNRKEMVRAHKAPGDGAGAIVFDDNASCLRCNGSKRHSPSLTGVGAEKVLLSALCQSGIILHISLVGRIVSLRRKNYLLCTKCGCLVELTRLEGNGSYLVCAFCSLPPARSCQICRRLSNKAFGAMPSTWSNREYIVYGGVDTGTLSRGKICAACVRTVDTKRRKRFADTDVVCV
jgi:hypothetical protein